MSALIYPADQLRQVFLGTLVLGDETQAYQYGRDPIATSPAGSNGSATIAGGWSCPIRIMNRLLDVIELVPEQ